MKKPNITLIVIVILFIAFVVWLIKTPARTAPSKYDALATCIKDSGATFYGAFWCPHCQAQKKLFGTAAKLLPYIECSTPDGSGQLQVCKDAKISGYPTWVFKNGTILSGEVTLDELAKQTSCVLPQ
ncbi:MAG: thioredoxin domain-containing protein [Minisyncoccia bacterium]